MKILVAVDGSEYSKRMLAYLATHEDLLGKDHELMLLHVVTPIPPHPAGFLDPSLLKSYYRDTANAVLDPISRFADLKHWKFHAESAVGAAAEIIAARADAGRYDLIMMGSHGHTSLANLVLGSVATEVLSRSKVPVLVVR